MDETVMERHEAQRHSATLRQGRDALSKRDGLIRGNDVVILDLE